MPTTNKIELTRERTHNVLWDLAAKHSGKDRDQIPAAARLIHDLGADSLTVVEFTMELEEELGADSLDGLAENREVSLGQIEAALCERLLK